MKLALPFVEVEPWYQRAANGGTARRERYEHRDADNPALVVRVERHYAGWAWDVSGRVGSLSSGCETRKRKAMRCGLEALRVWKERLAR